MGTALVNCFALGRPDISIVGLDLAGVVMDNLGYTDLCSVGLSSVRNCLAVLASPSLSEYKSAEPQLSQWLD